VRRVTLVPIARRLAVYLFGIVHSSAGNDLGFLIYTVPLRMLDTAEPAVLLGQEICEEYSQGRLEADAGVMIDADVVVGYILVGQNLDAAGIPRRIGGEASYMDNLPGG
jgi:hypothetical protein